MKKILAGMISFGLLVSGNLFAAQVTVNWATGHSAQGGETIMTTDTGTFNSFCIEFNEHVSIGSTYYYSTSSSAIAGGLTGGHPDPISIGTAWLFRNFLLLGIGLSGIAMVSRRMRG